MTAILGISAFYHDSAAALVVDGNIVAAAQEERFTRIKHDYAFPQHAVEYCLREAGIGPEALDYVGVIGVEMFVVREGGRETLLVNELAPRVHNSGHWTLGGAATSQFEQHIRAIAGWPLGGTRRLGRVEMTNLLGDEAHGWEDLAREDGTRVVLYGKAEARAGRKMGHVTRVRPE